MKVGSLFTGYGGLDLAVGNELVWYSEIDRAAMTVLEHHHPDVVNHGDVSLIDFNAIEPVDILTAGYPCQPFSSAGKRKGKNDERHLWPFVRDAIRALRPRYVVLENVRGHITLGFADVLGDIAAMGMSARWGIVRASDAGAPHNRARIFIVAFVNPKHDAGGSEFGEQSPFPSIGFVESSQNDDAIVTDTARAKWRNTESKHLGAPQRTAEFGKRVGIDWGRYADAIHRWERIIGRTAPNPIIQRNERDRLNPVFVEWMMGLTEGYVTGHGLKPDNELKMLGNGVVPQQARLALSLLMESNERKPHVRINE